MKNTEQAESLSVRINKNLAAHSKVYISLLVAFITIIAGIFVIDFIYKKNLKASSELAEDIQDAYEKWIESSDDKKRVEEIDQLISKAIKKYPFQFAAQRAYFTKALMAMENEEWESALENFLKSC